MSRQRSGQASAALTSNGILLVNVLDLLDAELAHALRSTLQAAVGREYFVGVPLRTAEARELVQRLDDAAAETIARTKAPRVRPSGRRKAKRA